MLKRLALVALASAGFASGALAETQTRVTPQSLPTGRMGSGYNNADQRILMRQGMDNEAASNVNPEQLKRARKAVAMIKDNHCEDAYNMALAENDNRLALNIAVACKAQLRQ